MRAVLRVPHEEPTEIGGHFSTAPDKNVRPISFHDLATFAFPDKTDQHLSFLTGADVRTCRRWRAGGTEPPAEALSIIIVEIMKRFQQR